ncbi:MAG: caspase family protein [Hyphomicrobium sp.]
MCRIILSLVVFLAATAAASAEDVREHEIGGRAMAFHETVKRKVRSFAGSAGAIQIVQTIMSKVGLPMNLDVRSAPDVPNAEALVEEVSGKQVRVILYNPVWINNLSQTLVSDWPSTSILAHEIGHHLAGHMDPAYANHTAELEADRFSGHILNRLGATLEQAQLAMAMVSDDSASVTHPGRAERVREIAQGWNDAANGQGANVVKSIEQPKARGTRVAMLIGNSAYRSLAPLKNPKNDVLAVQRAFRKLGFSTVTLYDGTAQQIREAIENFRKDAEGADWAVFYYAGTGIEIDGTNYIVPIDVQSVADANSPDANLVGLQSALDAVKSAKSVRLVISDACRINPFENAPQTASNPRRLQVTEPPRGVVVAYSTRAGKEALDGPNDISPYAAAVIETFLQPGMEIDKAFRRINSLVATNTNGQQEPSVLGDWPDDDLQLGSQ